jgi:hypothetical protein
MQVRVIYLDTPLTIECDYWSVDSKGTLLLRNERGETFYAFADGAWSCCEVIREEVA